jgi:predicted dehydrogenase
VKQWLDEGLIGKVRHVNWQKSASPNEVDLNGGSNWRTEEKVAPGGYFDDLASHGLDLFNFLFGDIKTVNGVALNQQGLYTAHDAVTGSWLHENGVTGAGFWNFGTYHRVDKVEIFGSEGSIRFAVLDEAPIELENASGHKILEIPHPVHVQQYHVENIKNHLLGKGKHPSIGKTGLHTSWVMDAILGNL